MLRINPCKMAVGYTAQDVEKKICKVLKCDRSEILSWELVKESLDARKKPELFYSLIVDVIVREEKRVFSANRSKAVTRIDKMPYQFPGNFAVQENAATQKAVACRTDKPVVIVGAGPAGLVCAYYLAKSNIPVVLLERGRCVEERQRDVAAFWETGVLDTESNVQFGEGGAGAFSDGKLNTLIKDKNGRCHEILSLFVKMGAPEDILYKQKPHVGTDLLIGMVKNLRNAILEMGGEVCFESQVTDLMIRDGAVCGVVINGSKQIDCSNVVLAIGHSSRDTFETLYQKHIPMEAKAFAVGLRVMHPQKTIDENQYGKQTDAIYDKLGSAAYKLTARTSCGRGVYSFCMCPGGYVVNASSEEGRLCINGMSYHDRASGVANSAVIVSVSPEDYGSAHPLAGIAFQRKLEERAFRLGNGKIPIQTLGAFAADEIDREQVEEKCTGSGVTDIERTDIGQEADLIQTNACQAEMQSLPIQIKGQYTFANLRSLLTEEMNEAFLEGMTSFGHKIKGFDAPDTVLAGIEARTSSPVRIVRDENGMSQVKGLYPCGEGAGYAGGITSAAMDGLYIAERIAFALL